AGIVLLGAISWLAWRGTWRRETVAMPLAFFAVGALALVAIGRVAVAGPDINSRYFVLSALGWTMVVFMVLERYHDPARPFRLLAFALPVLAAFNVAADVRFGPGIETFVEGRDRAFSSFKRFGEDGHDGFRLNPLPGRAESVLARAAARGVYSLPRCSEPALFPSAQPSAQIKLALDELVATERGIAVNGWAGLDGQESRRGQVYIVLRSARSFLVFSTLALRRPDVVAALKQPGFLRSGFRAWIEPDQLPNEDFEVGVLIARGHRAEYVMTSRRVTPVSTVRLAPAR
ncbi:MAG: hypothetical protein ABIR80_20900, partial [Opitutaceae bacterium]